MAMEIRLDLESRCVKWPLRPRLFVLRADKRRVGSPAPWKKRDIGRTVLKFRQQTDSGLGSFLGGAFCGRWADV